MNIYLWLKAFHLISMVAWMAGLFYLPRLFVYHCRVASGSETDLLFQTMERKLLRIIMNPAMILTFLFGVSLVFVVGKNGLGGWFHLKMLLILGIVILHGMMAKWRKAFATGANTHSESFFRLINEIPTVFLIGAVILAVTKPF